MRMPVTVSLVIVAAATVAVAQDGVFKRRRLSETRLAPCHGSLSGGSQILPDGRVIITNTPVRDLSRIVYDVPDFVIVGAPEWSASERYDIMAQAEGKPSRDNQKQMMRTLFGPTV